MKIEGNYSLDIKLGEKDLTITPGSFTKLDIVEYLDKPLPMFNITFIDPTGAFTNVVPLDGTTGKLTFRFNSSDGNEDQFKLMTFKIYRRFPIVYTDMGNSLTLTGMLDIPNVMAPQYQRGWVSIGLAGIIQDIAADMELRADVGTGIGEPLTIIQPRWTNLMFLRYLANRVGTEAASGVFWFVKNIAGTPGNTLVFKTIYEFLKRKPKLYFKEGKDYAKDGKTIPIFNTEAIDNYETLGVFGIGSANYAYFDYYTGEVVEDQIKLEETTFKRLCTNFAYDDKLKVEGLGEFRLGRTTAFMKDWKPAVAGRFAKTINSLVKRWITVPGITNINCGDVVHIDPTLGATKMGTEQYTGDWLVERVIHHFAAMYGCKILLTRPGVDTLVPTTLAKAGLGQ